MRPVKCISLVSVLAVGLFGAGLYGKAKARPTSVRVHFDTKISPIDPNAGPGRDWGLVVNQVIERLFRLCPNGNLKPPPEFLLKIHLMKHLRTTNSFFFERYIGLSFYVPLTAILLTHSPAHAERAVVSSPKESQALTSLLNYLRTEKSDSVPTNLVGSGFTATSKSSANQGDDRALLFGNSADMVIGIGGESPDLEIADNVENKDGIVPHSVHFTGHRDSWLQDIPFPSRCVKCHTEKFTYVFKEYSDWDDFLGAHGDIQSPDAEDYKFLKNHERFKPFFNQKIPGLEDRKAFPFETIDEEKQIIAKPNSRLTMLLGARAARALWNRIRFVNPERYSRVKLLLLTTLACHSLVLNEAKLKDRWTKIWTRFEEALEATNPKAAREWRVIKEEAKKRKSILEDVETLEILTYLGIGPHQIILTKRWNERNPLESYDSYRDLMLIYDSSRTRLINGNRQDDLVSPLGFATGDGPLKGFFSGLIVDDLPDASKLVQDLIPAKHLRGVSNIKQYDNIPLYKNTEKFLAAIDEIATRTFLNGDFRSCSKLVDSLENLSFLEEKATTGAVGRQAPSDLAHRVD